MHTQRKWQKTKIIATVMVSFLSLSKIQGAETIDAQEQYEQDLTSYKGHFVYRDGLIRRHLDEIYMIFKRCEFLKDDGTADLYRIPYLDDKEQRDSIRMTLGKAYMAHLLTEKDRLNLIDLKIGLKRWKGTSSIFNSENQDRLAVLFSELLVLLEEVVKHEANKKIIRYLNAGDLHWLLSLDERAKSEETNDIPKSYKILKKDLHQSFTDGYLKYSALT